MKKQTNSPATTKSGSESRTAATESSASHKSSSGHSSAEKDARTTTDHDEIRQWAEARKGVPACVKNTGAKGDAGILRIDFPGGDEASLQQITWNEWFNKFDSSGLVFLHQDKTAAGQLSRFNKLVSHETAQARHTSGKAGKTRAAGR
jgi:hypothetical protein